MKIAGIYSFKGGQEAVEKKYPHLLKDIRQIIRSVDASKHLTKKSKEKTMPGKMLYDPTQLNKTFKMLFTRRRWRNYRVKCQYPTQYYVGGYSPKKMGRGAFREMDYVKEKLGVEVQFGKYAFMVYNVCAKMTIFNKRNVIDTGIEIVPVKEFADRMSTGVSYFEQFLWDLQERGTSEIDIPVLIIGISA